MDKILFVIYGRMTVQGRMYEEKTDTVVCSFSFLSLHLLRKEQATQASMISVKVSKHRE